MKKILYLCLSAFLILSVNAKALACSLYYFGGDLTDDGASLFVRVEDGDLNDENMLYLVSERGKHKAGEEYHGCYGFCWTFTHDSYRYVSRSDRYTVDVCPVCGGFHDIHYYEEAGTNEHGLSVTASNSVDPNPQVQKVDPFSEEGISEGELATLLLSECASAREAVYFLKDIVETMGIRHEGIGVMLCDQNEQWYVESMASHYFFAVLLPRNVAFFQANVSVFGLVDLDDKENIVATDGIIELAQKAGTFVGDAKENIIDYRLSLNDHHVEAMADASEQENKDWRWHVEGRLAGSLNYLTGTEDYKVDSSVLDNPFIMTNIGDDGSIVPFHNDLKISEPVSLDNIIEMLKIYPIGSSENEETHLYRFYPDAEMELGTVEWSSMDNNCFNVFVPGYPVLMTDTWEGYKKMIDDTEIVEEKPDTEDCYEMHGTFFAAYQIRDWTGLWHVFPEGWEDSYSATFSALSNKLTYGDLGDEAVNLTNTCFGNLQKDYEARFEDITKTLLQEPDLSVRQEIMTKEHMEMSKEAHDLALALYRKFVYGEESKLIDNAVKLGKRETSK